MRYRKKQISSMNGKVCIVTGANSGTGYASAFALAKAGADVVMLCRNEQKGKSAKEKIIEETGNESVDLIVADLSDMEQVSDAAEQFKLKYDRLDVLLNNAGGIVDERRVTPQGLEETFAGNYLGPFLLTQLLLDVLIRSAPSRIINVSSFVHHFSKIDFEDMQTTKDYTYSKSYYQAKLAMLMSSYELAEKLNGTGVTVNALHPGAVSSGFSDKFSAKRKMRARFVRIVGSTSEKAAGTMIYLATSPDVEKTTGKFYFNYRVTRSSRLSMNVPLRKRLWDETERILKDVGYPVRLPFLPVEE